MARGKKSPTPKRGKSNPQLLVLSREEVERYEPRRKELCISISDPHATPARLSSRFVSVLRLYFSDVTERIDSTDVLFAAEHATLITRFVEAAPEFDRIVFHCNMGVSRSPGVALGLCDVNGWATAELERKHPGWNPMVRSVLRQLASSTKTRRPA